MNENNIIGVIPCAGIGSRIGLPFPKELIPTKDGFAIDNAINNMVEAGVNHIVIVINENRNELIKYLAENEKKFGCDFSFVFQVGETGKLSTAINSAYHLISGKTVYFAMPDTLVTPNPFKVDYKDGLMLLCFRTKKPERFAPLIETGKGIKVIDKPNIIPVTEKGFKSWGCLIWDNGFTQLLKVKNDLTDTINRYKFNYICNIDSYIDLGTKLDYENYWNGKYIQ